MFASAEYYLRHWHMSTTGQAEAAAPSEGGNTALQALITAIVLVLYPNILALLTARAGWDQWRAFTIGNGVLTVLCSILVTLGPGWPAVWGHVDGRGLLLGALAGAVPLVVILAFALTAGRLGQDIIAMSIGGLVGWRFAYRLAVQVALATVVCEELAFRGLLFVLLGRTLSGAAAFVAGAGVFGLWHFTIQYNGLVGQRGMARLLAALAGVLAYTALGGLLVLVRIAGGGLAAPLMAHGVLDLGMFLGLYVLRERRKP